MNRYERIAEVKRDQIDPLHYDFAMRQAAESFIHEAADIYAKDGKSDQPYEEWDTRYNEFMDRYEAFMIRDLKEQGCGSIGKGGAL